MYHLKLNLPISK